MSARTTASTEIDGVAARRSPAGRRRSATGGWAPARLAVTGRRPASPRSSVGSGRRAPARAVGVVHAATSFGSGRSPAIMSPSTSRGVSPGTMPTILPRYITTMRSASATTSSSSVETTMTGMPASRVATIRLWTNSIEPTSTPRVGCAATSSAQLAAQLAREHDLLLVAAGELAGRACRCPGRGCRTP